MSTVNPGPPSPLTLAICNALFAGVAATLPKPSAPEARK